jgi:integrase
MARKSLTAVGISKLRPKAARYAVPDPQLTGHYIRVTPAGAKSFVTVARDPNGKQVWTTLGSTDVLDIDDAREQARETIRRVKAGLPAFEPPEETFRVVAENYLKRHVEANGLRSRSEIERLLNRHILPAWGDREFTAIRRSDVAALLDKVQDGSGARSADYVLAVVSGIANWYSSRHDSYISPIARRMRRSDPKSRKRARILDDDEIRAVWKAADEAGVFGAIVKTLLLTAQRREKVITMRWADISLDGEWRIPAEEREKTAGGILVLPDAVTEILKQQPHMGDNPHVFAGRGDGHFNGFSKAKVAFDAKTKIAPWVLHDLRRTAKSLMARAGVRPDISERVLGHVIPGVEGVYDRHTYRAEKADALKRLAALVETIVNPPAGNVVALRAQ